MDRGKAAKAVGIFAAVGLVGWAFESNVSGVEGDGVRQSHLCAQVRAGAQSMPTEDARERTAQVAEEACDAGFPEAPAQTRTAVSAPSPHPTSADQSANPVAKAQRRYVEQALARLPRDGPVTVGGVTLPSGSRRQGFWSTDAPTRDAVALADRLARAFPKTGLWPMLWDWEDTPDSYVYPASPATADGIDPRAALDRSWRASHDGNDGIDGIDHLASAGAHPRFPQAPFAQLAAAGGLEAENGAAILLVPVRRPADAVAALGTAFSEEVPIEDLTAVARSWEDRFGAVPTKTGPDSLAFSVGAPPSGGGRLRALAAEQIAFAPGADVQEVTDLARALSHRAGEQYSGRDAWFFYWAD